MMPTAIEKKGEKCLRSAICVLDYAVGMRILD